MADYLINGAVTNALNMPSITAEEAPRLTPFVRLAEKLGSFAGQLTEEPIKEIEIVYRRRRSPTMNTRALTGAALAGLLRPQVADVNMVSAPIMVEGARHHASPRSSATSGRLRRLHPADGDDREAGRARSPAPCFSDGKPRIIQIKGINMEAEVGPHMLYITNADKPGFIGRLGTLLGEHGVNIANFHLGRNRPGGDAIALLYVDAPFPENVLEQVGRTSRSTRPSGCSSTSTRCDPDLSRRSKGAAWSAPFCSARSG